MRVPGAPPRRLATRCSTRGYLAGVPLARLGAGVRGQAAGLRDRAHGRDAEIDAFAVALAGLHDEPRDRSSPMEAARHAESAAGSQPHLRAVSSRARRAISPAAEPPARMPPWKLPSRRGSRRDDAAVAARGWRARRGAPLHASCRAGTCRVDTHFYPLGSCTMKYNPKVNERGCAALPGFAACAPAAAGGHGAGHARACCAIVQALAEIAGHAGVSLQPAAGAQGELTGAA